MSRHDRAPAAFPEPAALYAAMPPLLGRADARKAAEDSGWPAHCPDRHCRGGVCDGALRRLAPGLKREHPTCLAFAIQAVVDPDGLNPRDFERARAMMPGLIRTDEEREAEEEWRRSELANSAPFPGEYIVTYFVLRGGALWEAAAAAEAPGPSRP